MMKWECEVCKKMRPDDKISVNKGIHYIGGVEVERYVNYCNDNQDCIDRSQDIQEGVPRKNKKSTLPEIDKNHISYINVGIPMPTWFIYTIPAAMFMCAIFYIFGKEILNFFGYGR